MIAEFPTVEHFKLILNWQIFFFFCLWSSAPQTSLQLWTLQVLLLLILFSYLILTLSASALVWRSSERVLVSVLNRTPQNRGRISWLKVFLCVQVSWRTTSCHISTWWPLNPPMKTCWRWFVLKDFGPQCPTAGTVTRWDCRWRILLLRLQDVLIEAISHVINVGSWLDQEFKTVLDSLRSSCCLLSAFEPCWSWCQSAGPITPPPASPSSEWRRRSPRWWSPRTWRSEEDPHLPPPSSAASRFTRLTQPGLDRTGPLVSGCLLHLEEEEEENLGGWRSFLRSDLSSSSSLFFIQRETAELDAFCESQTRR